jgi:hypothetical protein
MKPAFVGTALVAALLSQAAAQTISQVKVFEGSTTIPAKAGGTEDVHVSIQSWGISGDRRRQGAGEEIPLRGFYLAHLLSGEVSAAINGQAVQHGPGDYWTVGAGATMRVTVLGEYAMLETTVLSRQ